MRKQLNILKRNGIFRGFRRQEQIFPAEATATPKVEPAKVETKAEKSDYF